MKIGLVYAMPQEIRSILRDYDLHEPIYRAGIPFYEVSRDIVAVAGGIGKVNIAAATALLCHLYDVDVIINSGLAGSFKDYPIGTQVLIDRCVQHDFDTSVIGDEPGLVATVNIKDFYTDLTDLTADILRRNGIAFEIGAAASGDWFATEGERAERIERLFAPAVADMEAGAIAQVCYRAGVKFVSLKAVSDVLHSGKQAQQFGSSLDTVTDALNETVKILVEALLKEAAPVKEGK